LNARLEEKKITPRTYDAVPNSNPLLLYNIRSSVSSTVNHLRRSVVDFRLSSNVFIDLPLLAIATNVPVSHVGLGLWAVF
jgi:hypothetical protein